MKRKPQRIEWETQYADGSGVEYAVRYNERDESAEVQIEHHGLVNFPLSRLKWVINRLQELQEVLE